MARLTTAYRDLSTWEWLGGELAKALRNAEEDRELSLDEQPAEDATARDTLGSPPPEIAAGIERARQAYQPWPRRA